jgi:glycerol-3-phosphate acyltransferase PlsY
MIGIFTIAAGYLLGSIPFGYLIVRWQRGVDVRAMGSGSIGATNVMRSMGIAGFVATLALDAGKGLGAVLLAEELTKPWQDHSVWVAAAGVAAILGHCFPVWLKFRGGKGVATGLGVFITLVPVPIGAALAIFGLVVALTRTISLGTITAATAFPVLVYYLNHPPAPVVVAAAVGAAIVIVKHHVNILRLLDGTEKRLGQKASAD